jgi:hypothetical protein
MLEPQSKYGTYLCKDYMWIYWESKSQGISINCVKMVPSNKVY